MVFNVGLVLGTSFWENEFECFRMGDGLVLWRFKLLFVIDDLLDLFWTFLNLG